MKAWVPVSFSLALSLQLIPWSTETRLAHSTVWASKTLLRRHSVISPPREGAWCLRERCKSCVKDFVGFLHKPGSISLFLSFTFLPSPPDRQVPPGPLKDPNTNARYTRDVGSIPGWGRSPWRRKWQTHSSILARPIDQPPWGVGQGLPRPARPGLPAGKPENPEAGLCLLYP